MALEREGEGGGGWPSGGGGSTGGELDSRGTAERAGKDNRWAVSAAEATIARLGKGEVVAVVGVTSLVAKAASETVVAGQSERS